MLCLTPYKNTLLNNMSRKKIQRKDANKNHTCKITQANMHKQPECN